MIQAHQLVTTMIPVNNSDLAWLVVSDYNQDNNIGFPDDLREDVNNPIPNDWECDYMYVAVNQSVGDRCGKVGEGSLGDGQLVGQQEQDITENPNDLNGASWEEGFTGRQVGGNQNDAMMAM